MQDSDPFLSLLDPIGKETFFSEHWGKKPAYLVGASDRFDALPGMEAFPGVLSGFVRDEGWYRSAPYVEATRPNPDGVMETFHRVPAGMYGAFYDKGYSLCFSPLEDAGFEELRAAVDAHGRTLGGTFVTTYLAPPGARGHVHFDRQHVFFMQVYGQKRWRFATKPALEDPLFGFPAVSLQDPAAVSGLELFDVELRPPEECEMDELVLAAGDALYLPPGHWHLASTEEQASLHHTLTISPLGIREMVMPSIMQRFMQDRARRQDVRFGARDLEQAVAEELDALKTMIDSLDAKAIIETYEESLKRPSPTFSD